MSFQGKNHPVGETKIEAVNERLLANISGNQLLGRKVQEIL